MDAEKKEPGGSPPHRKVFPFQGSPKPLSALSLTSVGSKRKVTRTLVKVAALYFKVLLESHS